MRAREAKALTVDAVAGQLLMSRRQVCGLESGDATAFHSSAFYERAREKYTAFLGVAPPLIVPAPQDLDWLHSTATAPPRLTSAALPAGHSNKPHRTRTLVALAFALGTFILLGIYVAWSV